MCVVFSETGCNIHGDPIEILILINCASYPNNLIGTSLHNMPTWVKVVFA